MLLKNDVNMIINPNKKINEISDTDINTNKLKYGQCYKFL